MTSPNAQIWTEIIPLPKSGAMTKLGDIRVWAHYRAIWSQSQAYEPYAAFFVPEIPNPVSLELLAVALIWLL